MEGNEKESMNICIQESPAWSFFGSSRLSPNSQAKIILLGVSKTFGCLLSPYLLVLMCLFDLFRLYVTPLTSGGRSLIL